MSVPSTNTIIAHLRAEGSHELADRIQAEAQAYRCTECGVPCRNPGIALGDDDPAISGQFAGKLVFYCPFCSGENVRPDRVEVEGDGFQISAPDRVREDERVVLKPDGVKPLKPSSY